MPDPKEGYQLAEISDIREGTFAVVRLVRTAEAPGPRRVYGAGLTRIPPVRALL